MGALLAIVGLIDAVVMTLTRRVADCPDGKFFPNGTTDFTCYVHTLKLVSAWPSQHYGPPTRPYDHTRPSPSCT